MTVTTETATETTVMSDEITALVQKLSDCTAFCCTQQYPTEELENYIEYSFNNWAAFKAAQATVSGCGFGETIEESIGYFNTRDDELHEEASGNEYYGLPMGYCRYGWFTLRLLPDSEGPEEGEHNTLVLWYETTRGTILCHILFCDGNTFANTFAVYLPKDRKGGYHNKQLDYASAGRTYEQWRSWYNCHCNGNYEAYSEYASFHNTHMVPLGWEPVLTAEQLILERDIDNALNYIHGEWAMKYGIGESIAKLMGFSFPGSPYPADTLKGEQRITQAKFVLEYLKEATQKWEALADQWVKEERPTASIQDYIQEDESEDYEGDEEEFECDEFEYDAYACQLEDVLQEREVYLQEFARQNGIMRDMLTNPHQLAEE